MRTYLIVLLLVFVSSAAKTQSTVQGIVIDSLTESPLPFVKVWAKGSRKYALTDTLGKFRLEVVTPTDTLIFREIAYREKVLAVNEHNSDLTVQMLENSVEFDAVVVRPGENPAFKILRKIRENRDLNDPGRLDAYQCEVYNKMQFDLNNLSEKFKERRLVQKFDFILDYLDSSDGEYSLPVLFSETVSETFYRNSPRNKKEVIKATRVVGVEELELTKFTGDLHQSLNIYKNYINLLGRDFMSPIAPGAKNFYKHYLEDEDTINGVIFHHITFKPRRSGTAVFEGEIWVEDSTFAITSVQISVPDDVNLNFLSGFEMEQDFSRVDESHYMITREQATARFSLFDDSKKSRLAGVTVRKDVSRKNFIIGQKKPPGFYLADIVVENDALNHGEDYWKDQRQVGLTGQEASVEKMIDSLKRNRHFRLLDKSMHLALTGYWKAGPLEIGNIYSSYGRNVIEGHRFQLTLRTSKEFSRRLRLTAFGSYGLRDKMFKYGGKVRWKVKSTPFEVFEASYKKGIDQLALGYTRFDFGRSLAMLMSTRPVDKLNLVNTAGLKYEKDWNFSMRTISEVNWTQLTPLGSLKYERMNPVSGVKEKVDNISTFEIRNSLIFTKDEKFVEGSYKRISLGSRYPIISLTHTLGVPGVLNSSYKYQKLDLSMTQNLRVGVFGKINYQIYAGNVFGNAPFPFLKVHSGSETYLLQKNGFNLMQYYEFVSDKWAGVNFEHHLQGLIMDRIPLINRLKIRTVYGAKVLVGSYSKENSRSLLLPGFSNGLNPNKPYAEVSVGIENLLKCIRVDAVWRLSYLNNVGLGGVKVPKFGVRILFATAL